MKFLRTKHRSQRDLVFVPAQGADVAAIREETLDGEEYLVAPVIALVEGVIQCSTCPEPELTTAAEFAKFVEAWNGNPVTYKHPEVQGVPVSANSPEIMEEWAIGLIYNAELRDDTKLFMEAWMSKDKIANLEDGEFEARIREGGVEISTGYFSETIAKPGKYNGEAYVNVQRDIKPDHLAILSPEQTGACSQEDGCGIPRTNDCGDTCACEPCMNTFIRDHDVALEHACAALVTNRLSDQDRRTALMIALEKDSDDPAWIIAVFEDTVVYENFFTGELFERGYTISGDGDIIELSEETKQVRPKTEFVAVQSGEPQGEETMDREKVIGALIANGKFEESDKEWLEALNDEQLTKVNAAAQPPTDPPSDDEGDGDEDDSTDNTDAAGEDASAEPVTLEQYVKAAPKEIQDVLTSGIRAHKNKKNSIIAVLKANDRCTFSSEYLETQSIEDLQKLVALAGGEDDYSANGGVYEGSDGDDNTIPAPPRVIERAS